MLSPYTNRSEAMRLINELVMSDVWMALSGDLKRKEITLHSDKGTEFAHALIVAYVVANEDLRNSLIKTLKL